MINLIGKINKDNYTLFSNSDFVSYEVYLASADDFKYLPEIMKHLNISSVHQPRKMDLCNVDELGDQSYLVMRELLSLLDSLKFKGTIVVHGNNFNELVSDKISHIKKLAERINTLTSDLINPIKIAFETDVSFFNLIKSNRALLVFPEDFQLLGSYLNFPLNLVLDFEHIHISAIFRNFKKEYPKFCQEVFNLKDLDSERTVEIKKMWLNYIIERRSEIEGYVREFLDEFATLRSSIIFFHINGTNPENYWFDEKTFLPLIGEHLCLGEVDDKLNYPMLKEYLPKLTATEPINIVMEIWPRRASNEVYHQESINSSKHLKKVLC